MWESLEIVITLRTILDVMQVGGRANAIVLRDTENNLALAEKLWLIGISSLEFRQLNWVASYECERLCTRRCVGASTRCSRQPRRTFSNPSLRSLGDLIRLRRAQ